MKNNTTHGGKFSLSINKKRIIFTIQKKINMIIEKYFDYIGDKTYINIYPKQIIDTSKLNSVLVELGGGKGNDMHFMITQLKLKPKNLFFIEKDPKFFKLAEKKLNATENAQKLY